jgi:hypothetical protein
VIGDHDPEDSYDAGDPVPVRLAVIIRILAAIADDPDPDRADRRRRDVRRLLLNVAEDV